MKPPSGIYQTEAMIYLHANRLYHVLPLVCNRNIRGKEQGEYNLYQSPRRLRAKYTYCTNFVYAMGISPLQGA